MAGGNRSFTLSVMNEAGVIFYGDCGILFVPSAKGEVGIESHHTPMIMQMTPGPISIQLKHERKHLTDAKSGIVYVAEDKVSVLVDL